MKTLEIQIFSFEELKEESKKTAIANYQPITDFIWEDAKNTIIAACEFLGIKTGRNSFFDPYLDNIDDNIMQLSGLRLRKYFLNNFELYKGKYYNVKANKPIKHKRIVNLGPYKSGNYFVGYYSAIQKEHSCILTGMCYDDDFLKPIYDLIEFKNPLLKNVTFEDVINDCFHNLKKVLESEEDYYNSIEGRTEEIEAKELEFLEDESIY